MENNYSPLALEGHDCAISFRSIEKRNQSGFMGFTHALSGVAAALLILAFAPGIVDKTLGTGSYAVISLTILCLAGASLFPDADNTNSTFSSALGFVGAAISSAVRTISKVIQVTVRTRRDDANPNPHRGAFHAPLMAVLLGFLTWLLVSVGGKISIPGIGEKTWGYLFAMILAWVLIHVAFSGLFKSAMKQIKSSSAVGEVLALALSLGITFFLFMNIPEGVTLAWLPISLTAGMIIHDIGDGFTTMGVPLLAPIPYKGKIWYNFRFPPHIKAGGAAENWLFIPVFGVLIIIAAIKISIDIVR